MSFENQAYLDENDWEFSKIKTDIGPHFSNPLKYSSHDMLHEAALEKGRPIIMKVRYLNNSPLPSIFMTPL